MNQIYKTFLSFFIGLAVSTACYAQSQQTFSSIEGIRNTLSGDTAVLIYANAEQLSMIQMLVTKEDVYGSECSNRAFVQDIMRRYGQDMTVTPSDTYGEKDEFAIIIEYYRSLFQRPGTSERGRTLGRRLYELLLGDMRGQIQGKTRLVIVPDGILNFLPFETLIDEQGKYLVENYQISHIQSLGVWELLQNRHYSHARKPLLAISPDKLHEVFVLRDIVDGADILTGDNATETTIKALSTSGELARYKVLHFTTQTVVTPKTPVQSALVLSQIPGSAGVSPAPGSADVSSALDAGGTPRPL